MPKPGECPISASHTGTRTQTIGNLSSTEGGALTAWQDPTAYGTSDRANSHCSSRLSCISVMAAAASSYVACRSRDLSRFGVALGLWRWSYLSGNVVSSDVANRSRGLTLIPGDLYSRLSQRILENFNLSAALPLVALGPPLTTEAPSPLYLSFVAARPRSWTECLSVKMPLPAARFLEVHYRRPAPRVAAPHYWLGGVGLRIHLIDQ